jgi:HSP20 family protein
MVYRTTLSPLLAVRREMDRLFDDAFTRIAPTPATWQPAVDVREEGEAWTFEFELPGVDPAQVEVTADQGTLRVRGEKTSAARQREDGRWLAVERVTGAFERGFKLPANVAEDRIEASFAHGLLTVRVPKAEVPKARRIEVAVKN